MIRPAAAKPSRLTAEQRRELADLDRRAREIKAKVTAERKAKLKADRRDRERGQAKAPTAGQRAPRLRDNAHLAFVRRLPCVWTLAVEGRVVTPCDAAHVRYSDAARGKTNPGRSAKPDDRWTVPLTRAAHEAQHAANERAWWEGLGVDPLALAADLYAVTGDAEAGARIVNEHARLARERRPA